MAFDRLNFEEKKLEELHRKLKSKKDAGVVRSCQGDVKIFNFNNKEQMNCSNFTLFNEGSAVITGTDGKARAKMLDGRGEFVLGPNSVLIYTKKTDKEEIVELIQGKTYIHVEPRERFIDKIKNKIEEKSKEIEEEINKKIRELRIWVCKKGLVSPIKCAQPRPEIIIGPRGTEFTYEVGEDMIKIAVFEGSVEIYINEKNQTFLVLEGFEAEIKPDGNVVQHKIKELNKWWKE